MTVLIVTIAAVALVSNYDDIPKMAIIIAGLILGYIGGLAFGVGIFLIMITIYAIISHRIEENKVLRDKLDD